MLLGPNGIIYPYAQLVHIKINFQVRIISSCVSCTQGRRQGGQWESWSPIIDEILYIVLNLLTQNIYTLHLSIFNYYHMTLRVKIFWLRPARTCPCIRHDRLFSMLTTVALTLIGRRIGHLPINLCKLVRQRQAC